jgi:hypothetical protein
MLAAGLVSVAIIVPLILTRAQNTTTTTTTTTTTGKRLYSLFVYSSLFEKL